MNAVRLIKILTISSCFILSQNTVNAAKTTVPDFSKPQTVIKDSQKELSKAIAANNSPEIVASLINLTLAKSAIDNDSIQSSLNLISEVEASKNNDPVLQSVLDMMKADIYSSIYNRNRWVYNSRELPLKPLNQDLFQWSGKQFGYVIDSLIIKSLSNHNQLASTPINDWKKVISIEKGSEKTFPTLLDFIGFKAISILKNRANGQIAARWLAPAKIFTNMPASSLSQPDSLIISTYQTLLQADAKYPASAIYTDLDRLRWSGNRISDSDAYFNALIDLAESYKSQPTSIVPLFSLIDQSRLNIERSKRLISLFENYKSRFGQTAYDKDISQAIKFLNAPEISYSFPECVKKDCPFNIKFKAYNCSKIVFSIYSVDSKGKPLILSGTKSISFNEKSPFAVDSIVTVSIPANGNYVIYSSLDNNTVNLKSYAPGIRVGSIFPMAVGVNPNNALYMTADLETGKPLENVSVTTKKQKTVIAIGKTDQKGSVKLKSGNQAIFKGTDNDETELYTYSLYNTYDRNFTTASFTTSLPVYHPGDKMQWALVAMKADNKSRHPLANEPLTVYFYDANNTKLDSITAQTDRFGRISSEFSIPKDGLTGNFRLQAYQPAQKSYIGGAAVMVSDYKLPTFAVKVQSIERDVPSNGDVTVTGCAKTYSGFPIANAEVAVSLSGMSWYFWRATTQNFYSTTSQTNDKGEFTIVFSKNVLSQSPENFSLFAASIDVTSSAGETRSTSCNFSTGKKYGIILTGSNVYDISSPANLGISVQDPSGNKVSIPLIIKLSSNNKDLFTQTLTNPSATVDLSTVAPGEYTLTVSPIDTTLADSATSNIILYNPTVKALNINQMLWTPQSYIPFDSSNGEILLATNRDELTVNMFITSPDSLLSQQWITLTKGLNHVPVTLPDDISRGSINLISVNNFESTQQVIQFTTPPARKKLEISIESFRDKVQPLESEKWTFTTRLDSTPQEAALLLNIFSASINDIKPHNIFTLPQYRSVVRISTNAGLIGQSFGNNSTNIGFSNPYNVSYPAFDLHGYSWYGNTIMRRYATRAVATNGMVIEEMVQMSSAPMMKAAAVADMGAAKVESADEESGEGSGDVVTGGTETTEQQIDVRPSEVPLALFQPMLTTDTNGQLSVSFTWPNSVTEWIINTSAYNQDSEFATLVKHAVAAKQIMINTNAPRFVRVGNHAIITATVMNNTDEQLKGINASIEIRSLDTNKVIATSTNILSLDPLSSTDISIDIDVDDSASGLLVISRALCNNYSDGEQVAVAVLPDAEPVIDTKTFYIAPETESSSFKLENSSKGTTTLELNLNPAWSIVTALPGLIADKPSTSVEAALNYFSAMTATGLLNDHPEIKSALNKWTETINRDSVLVSALSSNPDLKSIMLNSTPWVVDEMNDSRRMTRLALLFDKKETDSNIKSSVTTLKNLFKQNEGWSWSSYGDKPSEWATTSVLYLLGNLKSTGYYKFDNELEPMIRNAVKYIDKQITDRQARSKQLVIDPFYVYVRSMYPEIPKSSAAASITAKTIQHIVADWKNLDTPNKAIAAQILYRNNYKEVAKSILESIKQFAVVTPERGMYWPNIRSSQWWSTEAVAQTAQILNAYKLISPQSPDIDLIRQWLILEKSRQNWSSGLSANIAITAILNSGSKWAVPTDNNIAISVNGKKIKPDKADMLTGYFRFNISNLTNKGKCDMSIKKGYNGPAFGALYNVSTQKVEDVKASQNSEFSIEKRYYVRQITPSGDTWIETDTFSVGDCVRATLTIKSTLDLSYVTVKDLRPACLEPVNQLPEPVFCDGIAFYRENRNTESLMFVDFLPRGVYVVAQEFNVDRPGVYSSGMAEAASSYSPQYNVHSSGAAVIVEP